MRALALVLTCMLLTPSAAAKRRGSDGDDTYQTVIVGGGIAGMTAAYKLKKKDILVLEQWPTVGGRVWDDEWRGFSYARGAEYLGEPWGIMKKVIKKYKLDPIEVTYPAICHYNEDVTGYQYIDIYNGFDGIAFMHVAEDGNDDEALATYNRFMAETTELADETYDAGELPHWFDLDHPVASYDYVTMREWFVDRGFGATYQKKWNSHARGLYGANMDEVSILMAISELGWEYYDEDPIDMPDESWNEYLTDLYPEETYSFRGGLSEIPQAIAGDKKLRGKIRTNSVVTNVEKDGDVYVTTYRDRLGETETTVRSTSVVMAVPADIALELAPTLITGEKRELMEQIPYCPYLTVNMMSEEPIQDFTFELSTPDDFWVIAFYDSLWVQKWDDPDNPLNDEVFVTTAYIAGQTCDEELVGLTDEEILAGTYTDLERIFPGATEKVIEYRINRFARGYPLMGLGAYHRITRLNELNSKKKSTFVLVGDYMALPTMEAAMAQAEYAVKRLKKK